MLVTVSFIHNPKSIVTLSLLVYDLVITIKILRGGVLSTFLSDSLTAWQAVTGAGGSARDPRQTKERFFVWHPNSRYRRRWFSPDYLFTSYRPWSHYLLYMRRQNLPGTCIAPPFSNKSPVPTFPPPDMSIAFVFKSTRSGPALRRGAHAHTPCGCYS